MRVGAAEAEVVGAQVRGQHPQSLDLTSKVLVDRLVVGGEAVATQVLRLHAGLCRDQGDDQLDPLRGQGVPHPLDQQELALPSPLRVGQLLELLVGEEPAVVADKDPLEASPGQVKLQRRPRLAAGLLQREARVEGELSLMRPLPAEHVQARVQLDGGKRPRRHHGAGKDGADQGDSEDGMVHQN